jgi:alpha-1,2-mannosyltransferase
MLVLLSAWNRWMYGAWNPAAAYRTGDFADYAGTHRLDVANQLGLWISPDRGLLVWTPLLLVLTPALFRGWRELPDWAKWLLVGGLSYHVLQGFMNRFSGGDVFYGYRLGLELLACAAPALALSAHRVGPLGKRLLVPVGILQFAMILVGAASNASYVGADQVWTRNSFIEGLRTETVPFATLTLVALAAGFLFVRIWRDPGLSTRAKVASK